MTFIEHDIPATIPTIANGMLWNADEVILDYIIQKNSREFIPASVVLALGIVGKDRRVIGGVAYHELFDKHMVTITAAGQPGWLSRRSLYEIFNTPFNLMGVKRVNAIVDCENHRSIKMCKGLGFVEEGRPRQCMNNGNDAVLFGMLKNECRWI